MGDLVKQCFQFQNHNFKPHHLWKDSMKILLLLLFKNYLIYATFIYVCCDSFRIYCRGKKYSFFGNIVGNFKKILVKFLPTPLSQSLSIEPEKSKPKKKKHNTITFFETKIYPKIFWLKDQKNKTKRKKL